MAIPDYQTIVRPLLAALADGQEHKLSEVVPTLADNFTLTEEERARLLPSGRQPMFHNRVHWASFYLLKAGLLERPRRGHMRIRERGREALGQAQTINAKYLEQFPEFIAFIAPTDGGGTSTRTKEPEPPVRSQTPEEQLEAGYQRYRDSLASEVLARLHSCSPAFFEQVVIDLLVAMGYGGSRRDAGEAVGRTGDGGIDGIIKEDRLGLDVIYVQAKRWDANVGRPAVRAFAGSLEGHRARKGVLITTSDFSADAKDYVTRIEKRIVLINGAEMANLMIEHGIGVTEVSAYVLKRLDGDYFEESD
jgi:restriction system protein